MYCFWQKCVLNTITITITNSEAPNQSTGSTDSARGQERNTSLKDTNRGVDWGQGSTGDINPFIGRYNSKVGVQLHPTYLNTAICWWNTETHLSNIFFECSNVFPTKFQQHRTEQRWSSQWVNQSEDGQTRALKLFVSRVPVRVQSHITGTFDRVCYISFCGNGASVHNNQHLLRDPGITFLTQKLFTDRTQENKVRDTSNWIRDKISCKIEYNWNTLPKCT